MITKKFKVRIAFAAAVLLALAAVSSGVGETELSVTGENISETETVPQKAVREIYLLKSENGVLKLYKNENNILKLIKTIEFNDLTLREVDRKALSDGIPVEGREEALMLIEDFTS